MIRRIALLVLALAAADSHLLAQDRVILFEPYVTSGNVIGPGEIREIEISQGGRQWSLIRRVPVPAHGAGRPVALADGSRILWFASLGRWPEPLYWKGLVQYDVASARVSLIDIGQFDPGAQLIADRTAARVFVVEANKVKPLSFATLGR